MTDLTINVDAMLDFLVDLLNTPSPTGYHIEAIALAEKAFRDLAMPGLDMWRTGKGALMLQLDGEHPDEPRGLTAHVDTLGLMVKEFKGSGRIKVTNLGGNHCGCDGQPVDCKVLSSSLEPPQPYAD